MEEEQKVNEWEIDPSIPWLNMRLPKYTIQYVNKRKEKIPIVWQWIDIRLRDTMENVVEHKKGAKMEYNEIKKTIFGVEERNSKSFKTIQFLDSNKMKNVQMKLLIELKSSESDDYPTYYCLVINKERVKLTMLIQSQWDQEDRRMIDKGIRELYGPSPELPELPEYPSSIDLDKYMKNRLTIVKSEEELEKGEDLRKEIKELKRDPIMNEQKILELTREYNRMASQKRMIYDRYLPDDEKTRKIVEEAERREQIRLKNRDEYIEKQAMRRKIREEFKPKKRREVLDDIERRKRISKQLRGNLAQLEKDYINTSKEPELELNDLENKSKKMEEIEMEEKGIKAQINENDEGLFKQELTYGEMLKDITDSKELQMYPERDMVRLEVDAFVEDSDRKGVFYKNMSDKPVIRNMERTKYEEMKKRRAQLVALYQEMIETKERGINAELEGQYELVNKFLSVPEVDGFDELEDRESIEAVIGLFNENLKKDDGTEYTVEEVSQRIKEFKEFKRQYEEEVERYNTAVGYITNFDAISEKLNLHNKLDEEEIKWLNENTYLLMPEVRKESEGRDLYNNSCILEIIPKDEKRVITKNGKKEVKQYRNEVISIDYTINKGGVTFLKFYITNNTAYMTMRCSTGIEENFQSILSRGDIKQIIFGYSDTEEQMSAAYQESERKKKEEQNEVDKEEKNEEKNEKVIQMKED